MRNPAAQLDPVRHQHNRKKIDMFTQILSQGRKLVLFFISLYFLPLLFLFGIVVASSQLDISIAIFTRDPTTIANLPPLIGVASSLGVMLWTATVMICLSSWAILRHSPSETRFSTFLLCSGFMTMLLSFDDLFLLHDYIFPVYLGVSEKIIFPGYAGLIFFGIVKFKKCILKTEYLILLIALVFFGLSLFIDRFQSHIGSFIGDWRILLEDGFKLLGIVGWFGYYLRCCLLRLSYKR